ncbi:hypothetical protein ACFQ3P_32950 [Paraburkholderia sabiae]|uniref:Uncharacterized protein n=1 Tax=Paraburkholderia sabiae TaxID=273251 RepID=A0ABU9QJ24_9BURK|nr:hypothetical protein [Paraburkholderia sabiae]WJZ79762.1 hypothetical protein QEN71_43775 [Paraburkholderia sabiae]CAD6559333.1 hypothetical protein LMG24235_06640 [Paraburkholderia sabiae]
MKLAKVKVEYTGVTTITERVTLDPETGKVTLPPRLHAMLRTMDESECSPAFGLFFDGFVLPVQVAGDGSYTVDLPSEPQPGFRRVFNAITFPTKDQRQQNARYLHTLSAASLGGFVGFVHAATTPDLPTIAGAASLFVVGVVLWYVGFLAMKGD